MECICMYIKAAILKGLLSNREFYFWEDPYYIAYSQSTTCNPIQEAGISMKLENLFEMSSFCSSFKMLDNWGEHTHSGTLTDTSARVYVSKTMTYHR